MKAKVVIVLALALMLLSGCVRLGDEKSVSKISYPTDFKTAVLKYSEKNGLDPYLVYGIILRESRFVHNASSQKGAKGLMQMTDQTAKWMAEQIGMENFSEEKLFDPATNIELGCAYFAYLSKRYNNSKTALCAYNAGMGRVDEWLGDKNYSADGKNIDIIPYEETKKYVEDIENFSKKYREIYPDLGNF